MKSIIQFFSFSTLLSSDLTTKGFATITSHTTNKALQIDNSKKSAKSKTISKKTLDKGKKIKKTTNKKKNGTKR